MELIRTLMPIFLSIIEMVIDRLSGTIDFVEFQRQLQNKLNEVGCAVTQQVLKELDQQIKADKKKRQGWQVVRLGDTKEIITSFGALTYERTYYYHAPSKQYAYLVDEQAGYSAHMRVDPTVQAQLAAKAADLSYRKSAQAVAKECGGILLSGQTVLQAIRRFQQPRIAKPQERKTIKTLYIEADEDHVASQHGKAMEARLVYTHEGWQTVGKRRSLIQPLYLSSVGETAADFWNQVYQQIGMRYDLDQVEKIYILGDGAAWIQSGLEQFPDAEFILDRFHLMKYIRRAVGNEHDQAKDLRAALRFGHRNKAKALLETLAEKAPTKARKQAIADTWAYINNNWEGVRALYREKTIHCSAEGHISHVLSDRLSSRPMGWSHKGAKHMAYIRTHQANGGSIVEEYLRQQTQKALPPLMIAEKTKSKQRSAMKKAYEVLGNIPVLKGQKSFVFEALRGLTTALV